MDAKIVLLPGDGVGQVEEVYTGKPFRGQVPILGDVVSGKHPGRTSDDQIVGLIIGGDGVQFTAVGARIYKLCKERGLGVDLPRELFLQDEKYIP